VPTPHLDVGLASRGVEDDFPGIEKLGRDEFDTFSEFMEEALPVGREGVKEAPGERVGR